MGTGQPFIIQFYGRPGPAGIFQKTVRRCEFPPTLMVIIQGRKYKEEKIPSCMSGGDF